jgi:hypothetical protein
MQVVKAGPSNGYDHAAAQPADTAPNEPKLSGKFANAQMQKFPSPPRFEDKYEERE